jgi:Ca2+/Na+ antiporter
MKLISYKYLFYLGALIVVGKMVYNVFSVIRGEIEVLENLFSYVIFLFIIYFLYTLNTSKTFEDNSENNV